MSMPMFPEKWKQMLIGIVIVVLGIVWMSHRWSPWSPWSLWSPWSPWSACRASEREKFRNIDYTAEQTEKDQLFDDYFYYNYKNYDFERITDDQGNPLQKVTSDADYSTFVPNNIEYTPVEYASATPASEIALINSNVALPKKQSVKEKNKQELNEKQIISRMNIITNLAELDDEFKDSSQLEYGIAYSTPNFDNWMSVI